MGRWRKVKTTTWTTCSQTIFQITKTCKIKTTSIWDKMLRILINSINNKCISRTSKYIKIKTMWTFNSRININRLILEAFYKIQISIHNKYNIQTNSNLLIVKEVQAVSLIRSPIGPTPNKIVGRPTIGRSRRWMYSNNSIISSICRIYRCNTITSKWAIMEDLQFQILKWCKSSTVVKFSPQICQWVMIIC